MHESTRESHERDKIRVDSVGVTFSGRDSNEVVALEDANLTIAADEFITLLGPSGCGKSTLLYCIAGLVRPTAGRVMVNGKEVVRPGADRGVVFQDYALLAWRTVRENISLGLKIRRIDKSQRRKVEDEYLEMFGLAGFGDMYPHELSGGMRQRVAVARTLANTPDVVLMDEPFAAVDAQTRAVLGEELARISASHAMTVVFVTHSVEEAVLLGDRVAILSPRPGRVITILEVPVARSHRNLAFLREDVGMQSLIREASTILSQMTHIGKVDPGLP